MDKDILRVLNKKDSELKFSLLIKFMEESGIIFKNHKLTGLYGIASHYGVYLDIDKLDKDYNNRMIYQIILHEIGHCKRIKKIGKDNVIKFLSNDNFDEFCSHIIDEEIIADRYACFVYYLLNKKVFPRRDTQELEKLHNKLHYRKVVRGLFGVIKNDEEIYKKIIDSYIVNGL